MSIPPRTIRRDTRVFISAVTRELGSIRKLVKKGLEDNDYHAVEQDNFPPDYRDLIDKLRERIRSCDAVVHIAGHCYGAEPEHRPADASRRSYTQLEHDIAVALGKPVYVFLTGDHFPTDPHAPEAPEFQELQEAHRRRLTSTGKDYNPTDSTEELDQKIRALQLKVERLEEELVSVDQKVAVTGRRLGRWLVLVAVVGVATLGLVSFVGWQQQQERLAAEKSRQEAIKTKQFQADVAEGLLEELINDKTITAEEARQRAIARLTKVAKLSRAESEAIINRKIPLQAAPSPFDLAQAALARGNIDEALKEVDKEKKRGRKWAMLEGTAALARFRISPRPEWNLRALAAFQRAMMLADPKSPSEWEAWADAALSTASVLSDLARYSDAELLLRECLKLRELHGVAGSPEVALVLNNLAQVLQSTNRPAESERLYRRALEIAARSYGSEHPIVAIGLNNLAALLEATNRPAEAETLSRRALALAERSSGPDHPDVAIRLNNLAQLLQMTNRLAAAEPLIRRALAIDERWSGPDHPVFAVHLNNLALFLKATNRPAAAEPLMRRALAIAERSSGPDHPVVARGLNNLAVLLKATNRPAAAEPLIRRALAIAEQSFGPDHPDVALDLNNLAQLLQDTNRLAAAEPLMRRALAIAERTSGPDHPDVARDLSNLALLLKATNRPAEAEPLMRRALAIAERSYGPDHPVVAIYLNNLAKLLQATNRLAEAEPLMARHLQIFARYGRSTGHEHPHFQDALSHYRQLLTLRTLAEPEIAARIEEATEGTDTLPPIVPEVERLLGPARPVADVLAALDRQSKGEGKPAVYFLGPKEPITPHLDELLRPGAAGLDALGVVAFRGGAHADAVVLYEAALEFRADQPSQALAKLRTRMNHAAALRELGLVDKARDELAKLLPELDKLPATDSVLKGRACYHLALCQWRAGDRATARKSAEESLAAYDATPKEEPVDAGIRQQSEALLADLKEGKAPLPIAAIDGQAAIAAARDRYRACDALTRLGLKQETAPLLDRILGPARSTQEVFDALDRQYREQGKPAVWFLPLDKPIAPHLDELLGKAPGTDRTAP